MDYVMIVTDPDGQRHRIECATSTDLANWALKFCNDLADSYEDDRNQIRIDIKKMPNKEEDS